MPDGSQFCGICGSRELSAQPPAWQSVPVQQENIQRGQQWQAPAQGGQNVGQQWQGMNQVPQGDGQQWQASGQMPQPQPESKQDSVALRIIKRVVSFAVVAVVVSAIAQCNANSVSLGARGGDTVVSSASTASADTGSAAQATTECAYGGVHYLVPSSWAEGEDNRQGGYHYSVPSRSSGANFHVNSYEFEDDLGGVVFGQEEMQLVKQEMLAELNSAGASDIEMQELYVDGHNAFRVSFTWYHEYESGDPESEYRFEVDEYILLDTGVVELAGVCALDERDSWEDSFIRIMDSATVPE